MGVLKSEELLLPGDQEPQSLCVILANPRVKSPSSISKILAGESRFAASKTRWDSKCLTSEASY